MSWQTALNGDTVSWLLEVEDPGVRYLALRDLITLPKDDPELIAASEVAHEQGPIAAVLHEMDSSGFWVKPGPGYDPKYRSSVWSIITLAQLGASPQRDSRVRKACQYILDHALTEFGQFSASGTPGATADCLQGKLCTALLDLGCEDHRLERAFDWMARSITGDGVAPLGDKTTPIRYYSGNCGPGFQCGANNKLACAWGAVKEMLALGKLPKEKRTPVIQKAIQQGVDFLLAGDPAAAPYPNGWNEKPSGNWWRFGFPVFYVTDLLQIIEALVLLGYGQDSRLERSLQIILEKQDAKGRWPLEYDYSGKIWVDFGRKKEPNKWVTLRACWVLKNSNTTTP